MIAAAVVLTNCAPMPVADDEGHATFAREAIKLLLGRPARDAGEVEVVADIAQLLGRDVVAKMLMKETEFVDTWADVLVDLLQVQREGQNQLAGQDQSCWGAPLRVAPDPAIAEWVRDHGPTDPGAPSQPWNMSDLLRSAIVIGDLSPVYRANLFTLSMRRAHVWDERREELTSRFLRTYLNRDLTCLRCHNPTYSASNKTVGNLTWQRLWAIPGHAEKALFGNYYNAGAALSSLHAIMRGDVRKPYTGTTFGLLPWGLAQSCAQDSVDDSPANQPDPNAVFPTPSTFTHQGFQTSLGSENNATAVFGSLKGSSNAKISLWELEGALRQGVSDLKTGYVRIAPTQPFLLPDEEKYCAVVTVLSSKCQSCHSPGGSGVVQGHLNFATNDPAGQLINVNVHNSIFGLQSLVVPFDAANSELWRRLDANNMPLGSTPLSTLEKGNIATWINEGAHHTANTSMCVTSSIPDVNPDAALAFLTAVNLVDGIWMAAMGHRLTIDHGFPRNGPQVNMLWNLTEYEFLPKNWSLQAVLSKIVTSNWYARRAPAISQDPTAYTLPPILDPWVVADPTDLTNPNPGPHQRYNGQGELVDRFRVNMLLRNIAASLGWKKPRRFPSFPDNGYPSALAQNLGQYISPQNPGFKGINFQSLLALESETGLCQKLGRSVDPFAPDWIDRLVTRIGAFNAANPTAPITLGEAWSMLKDRLIQDPSINTVLPSGLTGVDAAGNPYKTEAQALVAFFRRNLSAALNLTTSTSTISALSLKQKLREGCGIIVKSPQFVLTNITPHSYSDNNMPGPPRLNVCMPFESCGYALACGYWLQKLDAMGHSIGCKERSIGKRISVFDQIPDDVSVSTRQALAGRTWLVLTRQVSDAVRIDLSGTPVGSAPDRAETGRSGRPPQEQSTRGPEFDLIKGASRRTRVALKGLDRVHRRVATLCPGAMCGFVERPSSNVARCLESPKESSCQALFPPCDPRSRSEPNSCGALPADFSASGVLAVWAEGAEVKEAGGVRILHQDDARWQPLLRGVKLEAGDLIDVPFRASLRLQMENVIFGDVPMAEAEVAGLKGHLLAITGPSAEKLLAKAPKPGALSPAELIKGVQAGAYDSRAMSREDWDRANAYAVRPEYMPTPTPEQISEMNSHFDELHRGFSKERGK